MIRDLQEKARDPTEPPFFIAADQEGNPVSRFLFLTALTGQRAIGDEARAFAIAQKRGEELRGLGVNINFAPVLDVASSSADFIFKRAFQGDAAHIAALGAAMVRGYEEAGIIAVAKHFPGHGGTSVDSHKNLPIVSRNADASASALLPFRAAVKDNVPMVMAGHIKVPEIDALYPASLSSPAIAMVRSGLGFHGVIITDDMGMGAIRRSYPLPDASVRAVEAGADIVLVVRSFQDYDTIYQAFKVAIVGGAISEKRINQSVGRILSLKEKYLKD